MKPGDKEGEAMKCERGFENCEHPEQAPDICPNYEAMAADLTPVRDPEET